MKHSPNSEIERRIESGEFPLSSTLLYQKHGKALMEKEYSRCENLVSKKLPEEFKLPKRALIRSMLMNLSVLIGQIRQREESVTDELQSIAKDTIKEMYNVPSHLNLNCSIEDTAELDVDLNLDTEVSDADDMEEQIKKRMSLNGLVHGSSMHVWKSAHHITAEKINRLDPELMGMYDKYIAAGSFLLWMFPPINKKTLEMINTFKGGFGLSQAEGMSPLQGINEIKFKAPGNPEADINATGINFTVLLQELNKGVIDYLITRAVPSHYNEQQLKYYYSQADAYENEQWYYYMSPSVWVELLDAAEVYSQEIPRVIKKISEMQLKELNQFFEDIINNKERAKEIINEK